MCYISTCNNERCVMLAQITTYNVCVYTGDKLGAGTDANVYIVLYGEVDDTGCLTLLCIDVGFHVYIFYTQRQQPAFLCTVVLHNKIEIILNNSKLKVKNKCKKT